MAKVKIQLMQLGYPPVDLREVSKWRSKQFEFTDGIIHKADLPDADTEAWRLSKARLLKVIGKSTGADITFAVTDRPIERNYYMHLLSDNVVVLTLNEVSGILAVANLQPEMFVLRNIYEIVCMWRELDGKAGATAYTLPHQDVRGCLYDLNFDKTDLVRSTESVHLCPQCKARLMGKPLPLGFVDDVERELKGIKKPLVYKVLDFVKAHPVAAFVISSAWALVLGLASNAVYGYLTKP